MSLLITLGLPRRWIIRSRCEQTKPAKAFFRHRKPHLAERAQPCKACCLKPELDTAAGTAAPLVAQALEICANAKLELPEILLIDALDVLTDPDVPD